MAMANAAMLWLCGVLWKIDIREEFKGDACMFSSMPRVTNWSYLTFSSSPLCITSFSILNEKRKN